VDGFACINTKFNLGDLPRKFNLVILFLFYLGVALIGKVLANILKIFLASKLNHLKGRIFNIADGNSSDKPQHI